MKVRSHALQHAMYSSQLQELYVHTHSRQTQFMTSVFQAIHLVVFMALDSHRLVRDVQYHVHFNSHVSFNVRIIISSQLQKFQNESI